MVTDLKLCLLKLIEYLYNEEIIYYEEFDDLVNHTFSNLVIELRNLLSVAYPNTKLKRMIKSIHYANGVDNVDLNESAFILD